MKKISILFMVFTMVLAATVTGCSGTGSVATDMTGAAKHSLVSAKTDSYGTVEELESAADLVVRATRLPQAENIITRSENRVVSSYTLSEVKIVKLYKDTGSTLKEGDSITVLENQAEDKDTTTVYHIAGYNMMVEGCDYLLFLQEASLNGEKYYVSLGVNYGTVSLGHDGRDMAYSETGEEIKNFYEEYEKVWDEARKKYA